MAARDRIVVVGASLAGLRGAEALRAEGFDGQLVMVGEEPHAPYDRPPLSKGLLAGALEPADIALRPLREVDAKWLPGEAAVGLDCSARTITTETGRVLPFDGLLIATGSRPRRLRGLQPGQGGVHELRTLEDALALKQAFAARPRVAIVGAGFIGVEVASTASGLGLEVELISLDPPLSVAGELVSEFTADLLADHGVRVNVGRCIQSLQGAGRVERLVLDDASRRDADLVLVAAGAIPATDWLQGSGLLLDDGIVCDEWCAAAGVEGIAAAGDVARWPNSLFGPTPMRVEHWTNAGEQARVAARTLVHGRGHGKPYATLPSFWSEHFGVRLQSIGLPAHREPMQVIDGDLAQRRFVAVARRGDRVVGAVAYGMPKELNAVRSQIVSAAVGLSPRRAVQLPAAGLSSAGH